MLSLTELRRAARILDASLSEARLERILQPDDFCLFLVFRRQAAGAIVLLSSRPEFARVCTAEELPQAPPAPPSFVQFFRAHLIRSTFKSASCGSPHDRQMSIRLSTAEGEFELLHSILGSRSNIYLLDDSGRVVHSVRTLESTRPDLAAGEPWKNPPGTLRSEGPDRWESIPDERYLEAIGQAYWLLEQKREAESLARRLEAALNKEEAFLDRKSANLQEDLARACHAEELKRSGELLKTALHSIRPGADAVGVTDFESGERIEIPLRPELSPSENLEAYFLKYQKERRGAQAIQRQLEALQMTRSEIDSLRRRLEDIAVRAAPDLEALRALAATPRMRRLLSRYYPAQRQQLPASRGKARKEVPSRLLPKRYRTGEGLEIWVGRSDEGNDYLTTRLARGNDLFFHLEGYPGSHVVLRTEGRTDPPAEAVLDACELAVHFSKLKTANRADVHVSPVKNVKKPKGAKPGLVYVARGRTVHLRRDPKRLQNILSSRLDV
jgi:predicted ribosome quality control (RQC) complex YloA/Tae2 family protein